MDEKTRHQVILGAVVAANLLPFVESRLPLAREAGLSDTDIGEAIALGQSVRNVISGRIDSLLEEAFTFETVGAALPALPALVHSQEASS